MNEKDGILTLTDEEGNDIDFQLLDIIEYVGSEYAALLPVSEGVAEDERQEVLILLVCGEDDEDVSFEVVEDFATVEKVFALFKERNSELFNFE